MVDLNFPGLANYIRPGLWSFFCALQALKHVCGRLTREQAHPRTQKIMRYYSDKGGTLSPTIKITADWCWTEARNCEEKPRLGMSTPNQNVDPARAALSIWI